MSAGKNSWMILHLKPQSLSARLQIQSEFGSPEQTQKKNQLLY
jgi:hypothetical protein